MSKGIFCTCVDEVHFKVHTVWVDTFPFKATERKQHMDLFHGHISKLNGPRCLQRQ